MKRILLSGGGTGGHIYPALSIVKEIRRRYPDSQISYVGTENGLESIIVPKESGIEFHTVDIQGFKRSFSWDNIRTVTKFIQSVKRCKNILASFQPDVVIGTGGYVSGPPVYAATRVGIPTLIHEQNVVPGLTTVFLSRFVTTTATSFEQSGAYLKKAREVIYTGNPRATDVVRASAESGRKSLGITNPQKKIILLVGGSRGARVLHRAVIEMLPYFGQLPNAHFVYVTGDSSYERIRQEIGTERYPNLEVQPFIYNMPEVLAAAHLVVSRAGASTLAEITSLGIPSILIPSPYVTNNHQVLNAQWIENQNACKMIEEADCTGSVLWSSICQITKDDGLHSSMSVAAKKIGFSRSAEVIVDKLEKISDKCGEK